MNKYFFGIALFSTIALMGCASSTGSKNTQFISQLKVSNLSSRTIVICRPYAFYHGLNSMGVVVNSFPAFDLGSRERYSVSLPVGAVSLEFQIPTGNASRYGGSLKLNLSERGGTAYVIVGHNKGADNALVNGVLVGMGGFLLTTTTWRAQALSEQSFEKTCGVEANKTIYLTDKSLN